MKTNERAPLTRRAKKADPIGVQVALALLIGIPMVWGFSKLMLRGESAAPQTQEQIEMGAAERERHRKETAAVAACYNLMRPDGMVNAMDTKITAAGNDYYEIWYRVSSTKRVQCLVKNGEVVEFVAPSLPPPPLTR